MTDMRAEAEMIKVVYDRFRYGEERGLDRMPYLYSQFRNGALGLMRPDPARRFADAAWRAGHDKAKAKEAGHD